MKFALISDIHGNLEALEAVLADIDSQQIGTTYCLGDIVGYGSQPSACLEKTMAACDIVLMGNHEYYALGLIEESYLSPVAGESARWTQKQLKEVDLAVIADLKIDAQLADIHLVHASPNLPDEWRYILATPEAEMAFEQMSGRICFHGHTHLPMIFGLSAEGKVRRQIGHDFVPDPDNRYLINVGSVGQPRDHDPRACYATYDTETGDVCFRRVEYDIAATQKKMRAAGLPDLLVERLVEGH